MDAWLAGGIELAVEQECRSTINVFEAMSGLLGPDEREATPKFGEIAAFYAGLEEINAPGSSDADQDA